MRTIQEFQFLIGTLKTDLTHPRTSRCFLVSIPYRYSKNLRHRPIKDVKVFVSIPYRYSKNSRSHHEAGSNGKVSIPYRYSKNHDPDGEISDQELFQFLIGTLKTLTEVLNLLEDALVSIPYRYSKNRGLDTAEKWRDLSFNSL